MLFLKSIHILGVEVLGFIKIGVGIFIVVFGLLFYFIFKSEKHKEAHALSISLFVSFVLGLLITTIVLFFVLVFSGATNIINNLFKLSLDQKQIIYLAASYLLYLMVFERIIVTFILFFIGSEKKKQLFVLIMLRVVILFGIGSLFSMHPNSNFFITIGVTIFLFLLDMASDYLKDKYEDDDKT